MAHQAAVSQRCSGSSPDWKRRPPGEILLDGRDITSMDPSARDIAMVFQNYALYPHMTVFENMAYGLRIRGLAREDIRSSGR